MNRILRALEIGDKAFGWVVIIMMAAFLMHRPALRFYDDISTPQPWLDVSLEVEEHRAGTDPMVSLTSKVNRPVHGPWSARITKGGLIKTFVCAANGQTYLEPETSGTRTMPLTQFFDSRCHMPPGTYEICMRYDLRDSGERTKPFGPYCSRFVVRP